MTQVLSTPTPNTSADDTHCDEVSNSRLPADPFVVEPPFPSCDLCLNKCTVVHNPNLSSLEGTPPNPIRMFKPIIQGDFFSVTAGIQVGIIPNKSVFII